MHKELMETFVQKKQDIANYSPLTLAYMGDCVYELIIRSKLVYAVNEPVNVLNRKGSNLAKAATQAAIVDAILPELSDEEEGAYRRGRNAHSATKAKNASVGDYRKATGFEALIGYLYIEERFDRIMELVKHGFDAIGVK